MMIGDRNASLRAFVYVLTKAVALVLMTFAAAGLFNEKYLAFALISFFAVTMFYFWRIYIFSAKLLTGATRPYTPETLRNDTVELARSREGTLYRRILLIIGLACWGIAAWTEYRYIEWITFELLSFAMYLVLGFFSLRKPPNRPQ